MFGTSLIVAILAFVPPWFFNPHWALPLSLFMQAIWLIVFGNAIYSYRRRALWLLLSLPFAFSWTITIPAMMMGCVWGAAAYV
jgi:hypothetical protein